MKNLSPTIGAIRRAARENFNLGWAYRPQVTAFQELGGTSGSEWSDVILPHDATIATERRPDAPAGETSGYFTGGAYEYRKTFVVSEEERGNRTILEFDGVYRDARVFVNGVLAGQHAFGYSRFAVRVDPFLKFGEPNEVRVECRSHLDSRWYAGAGIHRDVHLITKGPAHIKYDGVRVTTPDIEASRAAVDVAVVVENDRPVTSTFTVDATVSGPTSDDTARGSARITLLPGESATARLKLYVPHPELWNVDSPALYLATIDLRDGEERIDQEEVTFGIRSLQLDPFDGLRINGESVKLRGACIHSDNGPLGAASIGRAEERRVQKLKDAGFNAIRSSHNPASTALLDACDRLGMLVMDETFDVWTSGKSAFDYSFEFAGWWERDVEAFVAKDFNHPSVIFYSIGNEIPEAGNGHGARTGRQLAEKIRALDSTRFITNGVNGFVAVLDAILVGMQQRREEAAASSGGINQMMTDFSKMMEPFQASPMVTDRIAESLDVLDVAGLNYGEARYEPDAEAFPNRTVIGTETWPTKIDRNWELVMANSHVLGDFTWTGWDYLGENGIGVVQYAQDGASAGVSFATGYPGLTAWCGDIDITGKRRPVSYYRETVFGLRDTPYIAVHRPEHHGKDLAVSTPWSWSDAINSWSWTGYDNRPIRVEVYTDAEEVELLLNGESVGRALVGETRKFRADFELIYQPGELTAIAYVGGQSTGRAALTSAADQLTLAAVSDRIELAADTSDLAFIDITLTDRSGTIRPDRDRSVRVSVTGSGVLQALGSANPVTSEGFTSGEHLTFDGHALAIVRPTALGRILVTVESDGCDPVQILLQAS